VQAVRLRAGAAGTLVLASAPDAVHAFGDVDHLEVGAEGADQRFGLRRGLALQQAGQRLRRIAGLPTGDGGGAHTLHLGQEGRRDLFGEHVADQGTEPAHVFTEGDIGRSEFEAAGAVHARGGVPVFRGWP